MTRPPKSPAPRRAGTAAPAADIDPQSYAAFVGDLKQRIIEARHRASLSVNREMILLYWTIGRDILTRQVREGWGAKVVDRLAGDLRQAFPEMTGLSSRNLKYMRALADAWPDPEIVQRIVAQLPWGHNVSLLDTVKAPEERAWYARQAIEHGWTRPVLVHQIESNLFARQGSALTNFSRTLPAAQSELAQQLLKDPYTFDFLSLGPDMLERDLERGLIEHLRALILELGKGFAFVGSQYHLEVGGQDYYPPAACSCTRAERGGAANPPRGTSATGGRARNPASRRSCRHSFNATCRPLRNWRANFRSCPWSSSASRSSGP